MSDIMACRADKPKFGGPGRLKQKCIERRCILEKQNDEHLPRSQPHMINISQNIPGKKIRTTENQEYALVYANQEQKTPTTAKLEIKSPGGFMPLFKPVTVSPPVTLIDRAGNTVSTTVGPPLQQPTVMLPRRELMVEQTPPVVSEEVIQSEAITNDGEDLLTDEDEEIQVDG